MRSLISHARAALGALGRWRHLGDAVVVGAWLAYVAPFWNTGLYFADEGFDGLAGWLILQGQRPFVDFHGPTPALVGPLLHTLLMELAGPRLVAWRVAFVINGALIAWLVYRLLTRVVPSGRAAAATVCFGVLTLNAFLPPYFWYNYIATALCLLATSSWLRAGEAGRTAAAAVWAAGSGVALTCAFFAKPNIGLAVMLALALSGVVVALLGGASRRRSAVTLLSGSAGAALGGALWALALAKWGVLDGYVRAVGASGSYARSIYGKHGSLAYVSGLAGNALTQGATAWVVATQAALAVGVAMARGIRAPRRRAAVQAALVVVGASSGLWLHLLGLRYAYVLLWTWLAATIVLWLRERPQLGDGPSAALLTLLAVGGALWLSDCAVQSVLPIAVAGSVLLWPLCAAWLAGRLWSAAAATVVATFLVVSGDALVEKWAHPYRHPPYWQPARSFSFPNLRGLVGPPGLVRDTEEMLGLLLAARCGERVLFYPDNFLLYVVTERLPPDPVYSFRPGAFPDVMGELEPALGRLRADPPACVVVQRHKDAHRAETRDAPPYHLAFPPNKGLDAVVTPGTYRLVRRSRYFELYVRE